ncbi:MAG TPA: alcohol dehydrogenase catalytic domain-containing protein [Puia sp.]|jgi:S-(hydroxymethyl)glutathione dehydrogenase/alcohol dehydrogenase
MFHAKAAIADGKGGFGIGVTRIGKPAPDEVVVRIMAAGICHTDHDSLGWGKQMVLGHEGAGTVAAVGAGITSVVIGDRVMLNWATPCGHCFQCALGNQHICERNSPVVAGGNGYSGGHATLAHTTFNGEPIERSFNLGTLSEYAIVKEAAVVKILSDTLSYPAASIIGCGVMTGYGSVVNAADVKAGSSVVVLGTGGVGLNVIQAARISGAEKIIAVDVNPLRLEMAQRFGATHIIRAERADEGLTDVAGIVRKMTDGRGADYAFECTAIPSLGAAPLAMVRNAGMAVQVSGIEEPISIDMRLFEWDKVYINPLYGKCRPAIDFPRIVRLFDAGSLLLEEMISATYSLEGLQQAFDDMLAGRNAKGVIVFY